MTIVSVPIHSDMVEIREVRSDNLQQITSEIEEILAGGQVSYIVFVT